MNMHLNLDPLLSGFLIDYTIYKGLYDDALLFLQKTTDPFLMLQRHLRIAGILYQRKNYVVCIKINITFILHFYLVFADRNSPLGPSKNGHFIFNKELTNN